jgi:hypothetical protein
MHRERFPHAWQVGLVLEPTSSEAGFFYWRDDKQLGPVQLKQVSGLFDWATWQMLSKPRKRMKTPWSPQRWALGAFAFGLLSLGGSAAIAAWGLLAPVPSPQAYLLPFDKNQQGFIVYVPPGTWYFRLDERGDTPAGRVTMLRNLKVGEPFYVTYQYVRNEGLSQKPLRLWLQNAGASPKGLASSWGTGIFEPRSNDGSLLAVDLPELWAQMPPADRRVSIPLASSTVNFGRFYLRDVTGLQGGDRLIEIPYSSNKKPAQTKEKRT